MWTSVQKVQPDVELRELCVLTLEGAINVHKYNVLLDLWGHHLDLGGIGMYHDLKNEEEIINISDKVIVFQFNNFKKKRGVCFM